MTPLEYASPSPLCKDDAHRLRLMHMLLRNGVKRGYGKGRLAGFVFYAHDGKLYSVAGTDVWSHDYPEAMTRLTGAGEIDRYDR